MSSPLFVGQLVGVPLEIMHPTMEKDTTHTKIFVGGLPYHTNDASLRKYFQTFGDIDEAVVITDKQTGKSRGYGFSVSVVAVTSFVQFKVGESTVITLINHSITVAPPPRLAQQHVYPQAFLHPSLVLQSQLSPTAAAAALASPYLDYSSAYSHYAPAALEPYPYAPSPSAGYLGYSFSPGAPAPTLAASPAPALALHPPLAALAAPQAFLHYPLNPPDRMQ
ncbi:RNA-binding protein 38 [Spinachia spinachia]